MQLPTNDEFRKGYREFQARDPRDAMYKVATFLVETYWDYPPNNRFNNMANGLGVLLLTWNSAFYRYGPFDYDDLERCIDKHLTTLARYRQRDIQDYTSEDDLTIRDLFTDFLSALKICDAKSPEVIGRKSPVSVAKALHLLAPSFFPLWDDKIAREYKCYYSKDPAEKYLAFTVIIKNMRERLEFDADCLSSGKTHIKLIDEYNYAKYTKKWV
ncbi:MAG: hypothetical protein M1330_03875 [Armatimonadetes bacterium]|nr:hypothetical protein [Armatimonadota bacterium]